MKLLKTIRLDPSDTFIFPAAAEPGEWAISGAFVFVDADPATLEGAARAAFRGGFLGIPSLGWSTLAQIVETDEAGRAEAVARLTQCLMERFGAPNREAAHTAAEEEIAFTASLCQHPPGTLIAVHRTSENGAIRERFRALRPAQGARPQRVFEFVEVSDEAEGEDDIDLAALARGES